jgi:hypothetical protein
MFPSTQVAGCGGLSTVLSRSPSTIRLGTCDAFVTRAELTAFLPSRWLLPSTLRLRRRRYSVPTNILTGCLAPPALRARLVPNLGFRKVSSPVAAAAANSPMRSSLRDRRCKACVLNTFRPMSGIGSTVCVETVTMLLMPSGHRVGLQNGVWRLAGSYKRGSQGKLSERTTSPCTLQRRVTVAL